MEEYVTVLKKKKGEVLEGGKLKLGIQGGRNWATDNRYGDVCCLRLALSASARI